MNSNSLPVPQRAHVLEESRKTTMAAFAQLDNSTFLELTELTLPEIEAIQQGIAQIFPAGNVPALIASGLAKLKGRVIGSKQVKQDFTALMRGVEHLVGQGIYSFFAGPALAIDVYQKLLKLTGKDVSSAFPEGTWQFYLQFSLREDTARHANETLSFHPAATAPLDPVTAAAAWVCAAMEMIYSYDDLLAADWSERVTLRMLLEEAEAIKLAHQPPFNTMGNDWNKALPYHHPADGSDYLVHRDATFQRFIQTRIKALPAEAQGRFHQRYQTRRAEELAAYQAQMSWLTTLQPGRYQDDKTPISPWQAMIAFVWQGHTYLLPACWRDEHGSPLCFPSPEATPLPLYAVSEGELCDANRQALRVDNSGRVCYQANDRLLGRLQPPAPELVKGWLAAILQTSGMPSRPARSLDLLLAQSPRALQQQLREKLPEATQAELGALRRAPIVINWDAVSQQLPLARIRQGQRGIGDHALTVFRTEQSFVFDQSHIFFDGMWGMAVAEIMTDSAVHWYRRLKICPIVSHAAPPPPLVLNDIPADVEALARSERDKASYQPGGEAMAESGGVDVQNLHRLRKRLRQRGFRLTINDLLLLYRFFHATHYRPSPSVRQALENFYLQATTPEARVACQAIDKALGESREINPALLIPMDASNVSPRERIFPTTFRNPWPEITDKFTAADQAYNAYQAQPDDTRWRIFDQARRELLAYLKGFGDLLDTYKAITMRGESDSTAIIRLLAQLPGSMQHVLDQIPQHIGVLNEIIKGNEVFSNVGRVAPGSSLARFISAKDDGHAKELVWGILTNDQDHMQISLRDFRRFVPHLTALEQAPLADMLAQDYLLTYVQGINRFVNVLIQIVTLQRA